DYRQLTGRTLFPPRARRPRWPPHLRVVLKLRDDLARDVNHELMLGGNSLLDAPIDLSQRGRRNVDLALQRRDTLLNGVRDLHTQTRHYLTNDLDNFIALGRKASSQPSLPALPRVSRSDNRYWRWRGSLDRLRPTHTVAIR